MSESFKSKSEESWFANIQQISQHEVYTINRQFIEDEFDFKIDLSFPCYRDENGKPWVFPVVRQAEKILANDGTLNKKSLEPFGYETFNNYVISMLLGENSLSRIKNRAFAIQTIAATGAIRAAAEFLVETLKMTTIYSTEQNIEYIDTIFLKAGFKQYKTLRYFNNYTLSLDIQGMLHDLQRATERSVVFLQVSSHNPTGFDPTWEDWDKIATIMESRRLFPFFFIACQGFATGDIELDVEPVRMFERKGFEFFCAQTFSWNFGLFNERCGSLSVVLNDVGRIIPVKSHLQEIINNMYSTPPSHGARIVAFILGDRMLSEEWTNTIAAIADRLKKMRWYLREELQRLGAPGSWNHITEQVGNFCYTGLSQIQVEHLKKQYHIYLRRNGRLNVSGLNLDNIEYVAKAINETLKIIPLF